MHQIIQLHLRSKPACFPSAKVSQSAVLRTRGDGIGCCHSHSRLLGTPDRLPPSSPGRILKGRVAFNSRSSGMVPNRPRHQQIKAEVPAGVAPWGAGVSASAAQPGLCLAGQAVEPVPSSADFCQGKHGHCGALGRLTLSHVHLPKGFSL